jgi:hypothetical protein
MLHRSKQLHPGSCARGTGGRTIFEPFQKDYYAVRVRPAFDLQERFRVWVVSIGLVPTHHLKTRKQEGSPPRVSITNLVEKYLLQGQCKNEVSPNTPVPMVRVGGRGVRALPVFPLSVFLCHFFPSTAKGSIRLGEPSERNFCSLTPHVQP